MEIRRRSRMPRSRSGVPSCGRPGPLRARSVRRVPRDARGRARLDHRDLRRSAAGDRQLALVGCALLPAHRQASAGHPDRAATRVQTPATARFQHVGPSAGGQPAGGQARPQYGDQDDPRRQTGGPGGGCGDRPDDGVRRAEGGEGPTPYEVLLHAAMVGDSTRFMRQDGVEQTWRIMQPLLDAPPPVQPYAKGSWGPAPGTSSSQVTAGGTDHGSRRHELHEYRTEDAPAERRRAVAVPADRRVCVPLQLPHGCADRGRRSRSTGCASRLRRAQRLRRPCSTGRPAACASRRSGSRTPCAHLRRGDERDDHRRGGHRPAGSKCGTP